MYPAAFGAGFLQAEKFARDRTRGSAESALIASILHEKNSFYSFAPSGKILFLRVRILCFLKEYSENTGERKKLQKNLILVFHFASKRGILFSGGNAGQNEWKIG